jgi:hypothetical protein
MAAYYVSSFAQVNAALPQASCCLGLIQLIAARLRRMRKLRVFESISIDGYFTDTGGDMNWAHAGREDAEFADWVSGNASSCSDARRIR